MQRFRDIENRTTNGAPLYDSESTRNVLARAAQIEAESVLTTKQVEALGVELGLSPESVRQALGEAAGANKDVATVARSKWPMTRQEFGSAFIPHCYICCYASL